MHKSDQKTAENTSLFHDAPLIADRFDLRSAIRTRLPILKVPSGPSLKLLLTLSHFDSKKQSLKRFLRHRPFWAHAWKRIKGDDKTGKKTTTPEAAPGTRNIYN